MKPNEKTAAIIPKDPAMLDPLGLCLELLRMQRVVDAAMQASGKPQPVEVKEAFEDSSWALIVLVMRFYGLRSIYVKLVPTLLSDWQRHKAGGLSDQHYLRHLADTFRRWDETWAMLPRN